MSTSNVLVPLTNGESVTPIELRRRVQGAGATGWEEIRFAEMLLAEGHIGPDEIEEVIDGAHAARTRLPTHVISARICSESEVARMMARQYRFEMVDLADVVVDESVATLIDPLQAQRLLALPLSRTDEGKIIVALADPANVAAQDDLPHLLGAEIEFRVAPVGQLRQAIGQVYQSTEVEDLAMEEEEEELEEDIRVLVAESGIITLVNAIIAAAQEEGASDIHIEPGDDVTYVRYRIDGVLQDARTVPAQLHEQVISRVKVMAQLKLDEKRSPQDGRVTVNVGRGALDMRVATLPTVFGEGVVMRLLDGQRARFDLDQLGFEPGNLAKIEEAMRKPWGSIIITGPTGSGKSTTLYAVLNILNERSRKIITVEDPVEQRLSGVNQIQVNERARLTFATALRSILRADPDVIMIGEVRDQETAKIAVESALTGHLVLSSLHVNDAPSTINRLMEMGVEPFLISNAIELIAAQRLVRRLCSYCRMEARTPAEYLRGANAPEWIIDEAQAHAAEGGVLLYRANPSGCGRCNSRGYAGRVGVHEVMPLTEELKIAITSGVPVEELRQMAEQQGMVSLRDDCFAKVARGLTSLEELARTVV